MTAAPATHASATSRWRDGFRGSAWWWGAAVAAFFATLVPYWIWNIAGGSRGWSALWRFPVAPNAVFDSYLYFQQLSLVQAGLDTGSFSWFTLPLRGLMRVLPQASIPELWIVSRVMTTVLLFWTGAWCIRRWSDTTKTASRWLIAAFWLSFLVAIGLRPGVFSWYLPFGFLGLGMVAMAANALEERRWTRSAVVALAALAIMDVYPWFLLYGGVFLVSIVATRLILTSRQRWVYALTAVASLAACAYALLLVTGRATFHVPVSFATYDRNGIYFSHMPLISNTVLAMVASLLLLAAARKRATRPDADDPLVFLAWSWIVLLALWLSPLLTGVDILNDHFIIIAAMLSWITLGFSITTPPSEPMTPQNAVGRRVTLGIAAFASLFFLYILQKAVRNAGKFEPYAIHLSIWLALGWAAWFQWMGMRNAPMERWWRRLRWLLVAVSAAIGLLALAAVVRRGTAEMPGLASRAAAIGWIRERVPLHETVCSDPASAKIYGAFDARLTFPNESNLMLPETDEAQHRRLITIVSAYDVDAAKDESFFPYLVNGVRTAACAQYAEEMRLLERLGVSHDAARRFAGCQEERGAAYEREVMAAIRTHRVEADAFRSACPWVVVPDDHAPFWRLPGPYEEIRVDARTSVWRLR